MPARGGRRYPPTVICVNCGAQNDESNRYCWECGRSLEAPCSTCGALNPPGKRFCGNCGLALTESTAPGPAATRSDDQVTERRLITVLFADLTNYTTFSEGRDPEDVRAFLTTYYERCSEVIGRFGGVVEKFIGDAVMAVWVRPEPTKTTPSGRCVPGWSWSTRWPRSPPTPGPISPCASASTPATPRWDRASSRWEWWPVTTSTSPPGCRPPPARAPCWWAPARTRPRSRRSSSTRRASTWSRARLSR